LGIYGHSFLASESHIQLYLLSLADITGIDIAECVIQKLKKNDHKYPTGKVQGDARKYTEI